MRRLKSAALAVLLLAYMALAAACGAQPQSSSAIPPSSVSAPVASSVSQAEDGQAVDGPWLSSDIYGSVTAQTQAAAVDDFHTFINKDWLAGAEIRPGTLQVSAFTERNDEVMEQLLTLIKDDTQTSHEALLVQELFNDFVDMEARNALGMDPVIPLIEDIQGIETLADLTAYLTGSQDKLAGAPLDATIMADWKDSTRNAVYLSVQTLSLGDADEYREMTPVGERQKQADDTRNTKLLMRVGYSEEEAAALNGAAFSLETEIASACKGSSAEEDPSFRASLYNPVTAAELAELSPTFPIMDFLKDYTDAGVDRFILTEPDWLKKMNELYTEENVEGFKALMIQDTLKSAAAFLDQECLDIVDEATSAVAGIEVESDVEETAFSLCSSLLDMAVGKMYVENYVDPQTKQDVEALIEQVVAVYRQRLESMDWLSEETRAKAIEKLDSLKVRVAYPDDWSLYDYSGLSFPEDGGLLGDLMAIKAVNKQQNLEKAVAEIDSNMWFTSPQTVNAFYMPTDNSINIPAGILGGIFYDSNASDAEQMGSIGMIIGHEITHGFDSSGSQYDKDGNMNNWWTEEDAAAFKERTDKVAAYFDQIEVLPGVHVNGNLTVGETVADLGGISCMLELASGMEDFDYEGFFTSFAQVWKNQLPAETLEMIVQTDPHPPGYVRTNATVQQVQEFYDTFGVEEGDGMYLAPEERLSVW